MRENKIQTKNVQKMHTPFYGSKFGSLNPQNKI